ncbi:MAG TPA: chloride channel protein [Bacteroidia bacterium]|nr:chloride channel protein [Bacteroidia bacterium]
MNRKSLISIRSHYHVYLYSVLVGVLAGFASVGFTRILFRVEGFVQSLHHKSSVENKTLLDHYHDVFNFPILSLLIVLLPAFGGLLAGYIRKKYINKYGGAGTDNLIRAFHKKEGQIDSRSPVFNAIGTIFTIGSGGSGGKEGPIAQIGAAIGVFIANIIKVGARARRTLLLAGMAAGLGAVFKSPLGGALTAVEMVYKEDIESDALIPCFIASVTAYLTMTVFDGNEPFMQFGTVQFLHFNEIFFYLILGVLCFWFGFIFIRTFRIIRNRIERYPVNLSLKAALGGLAVGIISLFFYQTASQGIVFLEACFKGFQPSLFNNNTVLSIAGTFVLIAFIKILTTSITLGSGGLGGIFGPSLFVGGALGAAVGTIAMYFIPGSVHIGSYIIVGMGAFYAGIANAPIAGIIMVCEMTGSYVLLPPLILVSIFTFILSKKVSYYRHQVQNRFKSPAHYYDMRFDIIDSISVKNAMEEMRSLACVQQSSSMLDVRKFAASIQASDLVAINDSNEYAGILSLKELDLGEWSNEELSANVKPYLKSNVPALSIHNSLADAMKVIMEYDIDKVAVVSDSKFKGYIGVKDIFSFYHKAIGKKV